MNKLYIALGLVTLIGCGSSAPPSPGGGGAGGSGGSGGAPASGGGGGSGSGGGGSSTVCAAGQQIACACPGGIQGAQACKTDGSGYLACDCTMNGAGGANAGGVAGTSGDSGASGNSESSGGGASGDAGAPDPGDAGTPVTCLTLGVARCSQMAKCAPNALKGVYGDRAACEASFTQACAAQAIADAAACQAAILLSCDSYFETVAHPSAACLDQPGTVPDQGACGYDVQCRAGEGCDLSKAAYPDPQCEQGKCTRQLPHGSPCQQQSDCDARTGEQCVPTISSTDYVCQTVAYGALGADCENGTNKQCQAGFYCGQNNQCAARLGAGSVCSPGSDSCDYRLSVFCEPVPPFQPADYVCTATAYVPLGVQCGLVNGTRQECSGKSYCDPTSIPATCEPTVGQGQACVAVPISNCAPGLSCTAAGTCQPVGATFCG